MARETIQLPNGLTLPGNDYNRDRKGLGGPKPKIRGKAKTRLILPLGADHEIAVSAGAAARDITRQDFIRELIEQWAAERKDEIDAYNAAKAG